MSGSNPYPPGSFSLVLDVALLNHVFCGVPFPMPTGHFVALYTAMPTNAGGGVEVAAADYVRLSCTFSPPAGTPAMTVNAADVLWPPAAVDWGTIVGFGVFDQAPRNVGMFLGASPLLDATLTNQVTQFVGQGDQMRLPAGMVRVQQL